MLSAGPPRFASFHPADIYPLWEMAGLHRGDSAWPWLAATQQLLLMRTAAGTLRSPLGRGHMENVWEHEADCSW